MFVDVPPVCLLVLSSGVFHVLVCLCILLKHAKHFIGCYFNSHETLNIPQSTSLFDSLFECLFDNHIIEDVIKMMGDDGV